MKKILKISCDVSILKYIPEDLTSNDLLYKYTFITSSDVERPFSRYKNLLTKNLRCLKTYLNNLFLNAITSGKN